MDWEQSDWFKTFHADKATDEFKEWWLKTIGGTEGWQDDDIEEYWVRCGWCRLAWEAGCSSAYQDAKDGSTM